jgi:two-component system nitrogen regulation response regulator NtrX
MSRPLDVLVVDDEEEIRNSLRGVLEDEGHRVTLAESAEDAFRLLEERPADVVLLDIRLPGMSGLDAIPRLLEIAPDSAVIVVTGEKDVRNGWLAAQRGAFDFIEKPPVTEFLLAQVAEAGSVARERRTASGSRGRTASGAGNGDAFGILGESAAVRSLLEQVRRVGPSQGRVLVIGENGAGKELVALALHALSKRSAGPFVKINCAAIPKDLVESELFGYERGAFTGAVQSKKGRLELADKGTLFLDEIGDLSLESQAKLLRAIETGEIERVGGTRTVHFDVRIVSATNKDLAAAIDAGDFREDLYYRLNVVPLHVPPLRERRGDVTLLAQHFLEQFCAVEGKTAKHLSDDARQVLEEYSWPGNVRELRNLMERAAILVQDDEVRAADLVTWLESGGPREDSVGLRGEIERREADAIRRALEAADGNVTQAAAALGIDRTNLHRKLRKYGISRR